MSSHRARDSTTIGFLGFFGSLAGANDALRGGLLATDMRGDPIELQVATPVRPNRVERAIWGDELTRHAIVKLLGAPLLKALQLQPQVVLTNRIEALETPGGFPLVHLHRGDSPLLPALPHHLALFDGRRSWLTVAQTSTDALLSHVLDILSGAHELLEPFAVFDRISRALREFAETDERYA